MPAKRHRRARSTSSALILADLDRHWAYLQGEWQALLAAPLSRRKATLVASLADAFIDRLADTGDILVFRAAATKSPGLKMIAALCSGEAQLRIDAVQVPLAHYGSLSVEDFMVSLYNNHSVQRLMLVLGDDIAEALPIFGAAMTELDALRTERPH
jgi:hypothetical protein